MSSRNRPPWHTDRGPPRSSDSSNRGPPHSSVPAKRGADSQPAEKPSKRTTTSTTAQEEAWVADEDRFVLQQSKKRAALRVKGGRAKPIDWLAVTLRFIDPTKTLMDDEIADHELEVVDPEGVFADLGEKELSGLEKDIEHFLDLEISRSNRDYWKALRLICRDFLLRANPLTAEPRSTRFVREDIDKLLATKSLEELEGLGQKTKDKLDSDEPIDFDYWEELLRTIRVWKAKAKLKKLSDDIVSKRLEALKKHQEDVAIAAQKKLQSTLAAVDMSTKDSSSLLTYGSLFDPQPTLKLRTEDKALGQTTDKEFSNFLAAERNKITKLGYVPSQIKSQNTAAHDATKTNTSQPLTSGLSRFAPVENEDLFKVTKALYDREAARGVEEGEEIFAREEQIGTEQPQWADKYKPRKPLYFNRVQMGFEWNKYNQTHYDHDNPPPKVVQGYRFNIFYPGLIDTSKIPTYDIERENGRKRGQSFAPAGEDDTCLIRFIGGPPYEDIAFRIVDKEWDYSAKHERGFRSTFDKGILQLHFQFKKVYYRK